MRPERKRESSSSLEARRDSPNHFPPNKSLDFDLNLDAPIIIFAKAARLALAQLDSNPISCLVDLYGVK